jgi:hypothetical protein
MKQLIFKSVIAVGVVTGFVSCKKEADPVIIVPPSSGAQVEFQGLVGGEPGSSAGNSVYLDLSTNTMKTARRSGWDLGFYSGPDFRVILNNTTGAGAKVLAQTDLNAVGAADTIGLTLAVNQFNPQPSDLAFFDAMDGSVSGTVIPAVSSIDSQNPVIILNRGTGGNTPSRPWIKMRVLRNGTGYRVQYAGITETSFRTADIPRNSDFHFQFFSFEDGTVDLQPEKTQWDLVWSYSLYHTNFGAGLVPYLFSDMIALNHLSNVQAVEKKYADATAASAAYVAFNRDSVNAVTFTSNRWSVGSNWRSTQPATGARPDRFYVIRDAQGNYYKFKCLAMGVGTDGGTRGKPEFRYELIR